MSTVNEEAKKILEDFGEDIIIDLKNSLIAAMRAAGNRNVQEPHLDFSYSQPKAEVDGVSMNVIASDEYWKWIESGRKPGAKRVPAGALGKRWQNQNGIDARQILINIRLKKNPQLKTSKNKLNYDKSVRSLAFVVQRSIFRKGIKPRPFVDRVLNDGRVNKLSLDLERALGKAYKLEIITELNGSNS